MATFVFIVDFGVVVSVAGVVAFVVGSGDCNYVCFFFTAADPRGLVACCLGYLKRYEDDVICHSRSVNAF